MAAVLHHATGAILDVSTIVEFFGGPDEVVAAFKKHGLGVLTAYAIKQWVRRQRIPLARQLDLQTLARKQGRELDLARYFLDTYKVLPKRKCGPKSKAFKKKAPTQPTRTRASVEAR